MIDKKKHIVCKKCGSDDVIFDAVAHWDYETQKMKLLDTLEYTICNNCEYEKDYNGTLEVIIEN